MAETITDVDGRVLETEKLDLLGELDLIEIAGAVASGNARWMAIATLCACVRKIDGVPLPFPQDRKSLRLVISKVGPAGMVALIKAFQVDIPDVDAGAAEMEIAKN